MNVYDLLNAVKELEGKDLVKQVRTYGKELQDGTVLYEFSDDSDFQPLVAAYCFDQPCDVYVKKIGCSKNGNVTFYVTDKESGCDAKLFIGDFFAGHITYITEEIVSTNELTKIN